MLIGAVAAALVGALVALPALRLGGLYLALATLAFALMVENVVFPLGWVSGGDAGVEVPRPQISPVRAKITVFALSAAIAGVGGTMLASLQGSASIDEFSSFIGLFWIVLVVTLGTRTVDGAVNAGMAFILVPELLDVLGVSSSLQIPVQFALFGFGAVTFARHPEGVVEANKRKSIQAVSRWVVRHFGEPPSATPELATSPEPVTVLDALESAGAHDTEAPV